MIIRLSFLKNNLLIIREFVEYDWSHYFKLSFSSQTWAKQDTAILLLFPMMAKGEHGAEITNFIDAIIFYDHFSVFVFALCAIQHRPIEWIQTASIYHGWIEWQKQSCQRERQLWSIWESNGRTSNVVSIAFYARLHRRQIEKNVFSTNLMSFFSNNETLIHLLKGSLGTGILAMPNAFHHSGWVVGSIGTIVIGIICTYCIHMLLRSAYELCKRKKVIFINQNVHFFSLLLRSLSIYLYTSHRRTSSNNSFKYKIRRWSRSSAGLSVGLMKFDAIFSIISFLKKGT